MFGFTRFDVFHRRFSMAPVTEIQREPQTADTVARDTENENARGGGKP